MKLHSMNAPIELATDYSDVTPNLKRFKHLITSYITENIENGSIAVLKGKVELSTSLVYKTYPLTAKGYYQMLSDADFAHRGKYTPDLKNINIINNIATQIKAL